MLDGKKSSKKLNKKGLYIKKRRQMKKKKTSKK